MFQWRSVGAAAVILSFISPLAGTAQTDLGQTPTDGAAVVDRSINPGQELLVEMQASADATCSLHPDGVIDAQHRLHLDADASGVVRFHAKAQGASDAPLPMVLDCTDTAGNQNSYTVRLTATSNASGAVNALKQLTTNQRAASPGVLQTHLDVDPATLTNQELVQRGYPPRPDATQSPAAFKQWSKIVSSSFAVVNPRAVEHPEVRHAPTLPLPPPVSRLSPTLPTPPPEAKFANKISFRNWSGAYVTNPDVRFWDVQADWLVPRVGDVPWYLGYAAAAEWVGLDNAGNDLVQSGTDSEAFHYLFFGFDWTFTNYSVWIESLPYAPYFLPNFPASPGDEISISIFLADQYGNTTFQYGDITPSDNNVWFMIYNLTTHNSYWGTLPRPAAFSGSTVDFVIEAPSVNGSTTNLANFGIASMHDCYYADSWYGFTSLDYNGSDPLVGTLNDITMYNGSTRDTLASSYIYANFGYPGGGNVLWVWQNYY